MRQVFPRLALWIGVIAFGIQLGAATYETRVITPLWAGNLPASVRNWNPDPAFAIHPERYWAPGSIFVTLAILLLLSASFIRSPYRIWCLVAGLAGLLTLVSTMTFFVPILRRTIFDRGATLTDEQIVHQVGLWVSWGWLRYAVLAAGWLAAIRGLTISAARVPATSRQAAADVTAATPGLP